MKRNFTFMFSETLWTQALENYSKMRFEGEEEKWFVSLCTLKPLPFLHRVWAACCCQQALKKRRETAGSMVILKDKPTVSRVTWKQMFCAAREGCTQAVTVLERLSAISS